MGKGAQRRTVWGVRAGVGVVRIWVWVGGVRARASTRAPPPMQAPRPSESTPPTPSSTPACSDGYAGPPGATLRCQRDCCRRGDRCAQTS
ncbi:hypothetical protein B484DRAFT_443697 [Ochromonadaceae sp. CCMP2298]|nr:hypothetical protein B484DRAFT_443697 [Ochromonadaceae sp. CCMP2298]